ncbi:hypothetical protein DIPPA_10127 [Diplonema papillatum]|nr:hypothetical protein DIPPA_10127 [Diplonema papillatum]
MESRDAEAKMEPVKATSLEEVLKAAMERKGNVPAQFWASERLQHGLQLSDDALTLSHSSPAATSTECSVQARWPLTLMNGVGYYEIDVLHCSSPGSSVMVGLANKGFSTLRHPSGRKQCVGYLSAGKVTRYEETIPYGSRYGSGDRIGCGFCKRTREVWFTKNGRYLGDAVAYPELGLDQVYPMVTVEQAAITGVFEPSRFKWCATDFINDERKFIIKAVLEAPLPTRDVTAEMVASYLLFHGYSKTFHQFLKAYPIENGRVLLNRLARKPRGYSEDGEEEEGDDEPMQCDSPGVDSLPRSVPELVQYSRLELRSAVIASIMDGKVREAARLIEEEVPDLVGQLRPVLVSQVFVESLRNDDLEAAMAAIAQPECNTPDGPHPAVANVVGLLAYADPSTSPLAHLLTDSQRRHVADTVNAAILEHLKVQPESIVESMIKHITTIPVLAKERFCPGVSF